MAEKLAASGYGKEANGPLLRHVQEPRADALAAALRPCASYSNFVIPYLTQTGITGENMGSHGLRVIAATSVLEHNADIAKVQEWLGHTIISTTRMYDRRGFRLKDWSTFKVA